MNMSISIIQNIAKLEYTPKYLQIRRRSSEKVPGSGHRQDAFESWGSRQAEWYSKAVGGTDTQSQTGCHQRQETEKLR